MFRMSRRIALRKTATARPNEFNYSFRALAVGYELLTPPIVGTRGFGSWPSLECRSLGPPVTLAKWRMAAPPSHGLESPADFGKFVADDQKRPSTCPDDL